MAMRGYWDELWRELLREGTQAYACTAGIKGGVARCRNLIPCSAHPDGTPKAPRPDRVLLKVNLSKAWDDRFQKAGIPLLQRTWERAQQLRADHVESAGQLGRNAFAVRTQQSPQRNQTFQGQEVPENADTGCPVFGNEGVTKGVSGQSLSKTSWDLRDAGFRLVAAHRLQRNWKPPVRLVLIFEKGQGARDVQFPWELFRELVATCFKQVDVWANERRPDNLVVHTVNCGARDDKATPAYGLRFAGGDWGVQTAISSLWITDLWITKG